MAPVHDGVEIEVEDCLVRRGQTAADHLLVQGGQELPLVVMREPVGVIGERGFLRQDRQPGEQAAGRVADQVIDVGYAAGAGQLQGQQGQQPRHCRDNRGAWVAGGPDQGGQVQGYKVGDGQQQPGEPGIGAGGERGEVHDRGAGQLRVPAGGRRAGAGGWCGAAQQPAEALLGKDLPYPGAVERSALRAQPGTDLIDRQALAAQFGHPCAGAVLGRGGLGAGLAGRGEQLQLPGPEITQQAGHCRSRVAGAGLGDGQALGEVSAQRLIPALVRVPGAVKYSAPGAGFAATRTVYQNHPAAGCNPRSDTLPLYLPDHPVQSACNGTTRPILLP